MASLLASSAALAAQATTSFRISPGDAATALKLFSEQSGVSIMFSPENVAGVSTKEVMGEMPVQVALERLLAGTSLYAVATKEPVGYAIKRNNNGKNSPNSPRMRTKSDQTTQNDDVVTLSPFAVNAETDQGYQSRESTTATGVSKPLIDIAQNVQVVNSLLIKDAYLTSPNESAKFVAGAQFRGQGFYNNSIILRGFDASVQRNGVNFSAGAPITAGIERIEYLKGPAAIFNGNVRPGGIVNYVTYQPKFSSFQGEAAVTVGSYEYRKFGAHITGPLIRNKLAYFLQYSTLESEDWVEYSGEDTDEFYGALTFRPFRRLTISVNRQDRDRFYQSHPNVSTSTPLLQFSNTPPSVEIATFLKAYPPGTPQSSEVVNSVMYPKGWRSNANGPQAHQDAIWDSSELDTTLSVNDAITVHNTVTRTRGENYTLTTNPFRATNQYSLAASARASEVLDRTKSLNVTTEVSFDVSFWKTRHQLVVGHEYTDFWRGSANRAGIASIFPYNPRTDGPRYILNEVEAQNPGSPLNRSPAFTTVFETQGIFAVDHLTLLDGRVHASLGARRTTADQGGRGKVDPLNRALRTTPSAGAVYKFQNGLALFASYSETFEPSNLVDFLSKPVPPVLGKGADAGIKVGTSNLSATLSYFHVVRDNIASRDFDKEAQLRAQGVVSERALQVYILGGQETSEGVELEARYANKNLEVLFAYSNMWEANVTKAAPDSAGNTFNLGIRLWDAPRQTMNLLTQYTFTEGRLKGLSVAGNVEFQSERLIHPSPLTAAKQSGYAVVDLSARYHTRLFGRGVEFALNGKNVGNEKYLGGFYVLADVRKVFFTTRLRF